LPVEAGKRGARKPMPLYTVGHSNHPADRLFEIIAPFSITVIIDVRSVPYSGRFPHFNRDSISQLCEQHGISYEWWGDSLGGLREPDDSIERGVGKLIEHFGKDETEEVGCLLCAESDPGKCHRSILIGPALRAYEGGGVDLHHILPDGTLILQSELEEKQAAPKGDRAGTLALFD
jgi:hypothetical protein